jgi:hypothetical protein
MLNMHWFASPISQTQPRHLFSTRSTVYIFSYCYFFDLCRHCSMSDTANTAVYVIYHTNTCRFCSGRLWCCSVPKQAPAGSVSEARGWPSATGWLQRRRQWASPETERDRHTVLSCLSFVDGHNWMAFMIIQKHQTRREIYGWFIPSPHLSYI